jgi:hypothetical protein
MPVKNVNWAHFDACTVSYAQIKVHCHISAVDSRATCSIFPDLQISMLCGDPVALKVRVNGHDDSMIAAKSTKFKHKPTESESSYITVGSSSNSLS